MWTMWDAPSDRDYYDQFGLLEPEEDPENWPLEYPEASTVADEATEVIDVFCPF